MLDMILITFYKWKLKDIKLHVQSHTALVNGRVIFIVKAQEGSGSRFFNQ